MISWSKSILCRACFIFPAGRYAADQVMSLNADVARRAAAARTPGGFGSATDRFGADVHGRSKAGCHLAATPFLDVDHAPSPPAPQSATGCYAAGKAATHQLARVQERLSPVRCLMEAVQFI
jgi:hypothetical protein